MDFPTINEQLAYNAMTAWSNTVRGRMNAVVDLLLLAMCAVLVMFICCRERDSE